MKNVIFNILTVLILLATVGVGAVYAAVLFSGGGPDLSALSSISAAPPPALPTAIVLPTSTETPRKLAPTWTETVNAIATYDASRKYATSTPIPGGSNGGGGTPYNTSIPYTIPTFTAIPSATIIPSLTPTPVTPTYTPSNTYTPYPTSTPYPTNTPYPGNYLTATANAINYSITQTAQGFQLTQIALTQMFQGQTQTAQVQTLTATYGPGATAIAQTLTATAGVLQTQLATNTQMAQTMTATYQSVTLTVQGLPANPSSADEVCYRTHTIASGAWQNVCNSLNFQWFNPTSATAYYLYWGTDPNGTNDYVAPISAVTPTTTYHPADISTPNAGVTYYLRVRTKFGSIERADYTTIFVVRYDNVPPNNPTSASVSGVSNNTWQNGVTSPTFNMSGANDPGSGSGGIQYLFKWQAAGGGTPSSPLAPIANASPTFNPGSVSDGIYELWAQAIDAAGNLNTTPVKVFTFKLDTTKPQAPTGLTDDPSDPPGNYSHSSADYNWNPVTNDVTNNPDLSGIKNYQVYWGTNSIPVESNVVTVSPDGSTFYSAPSMTVNGATYYFFVRTVDNAGNQSAWSIPIILTYTGH